MFLIFSVLAQYMSGVHKSVKKVRVILKTSTSPHNRTVERRGEDEELLLSRSLSLFRFLFLLTSTGGDKVHSRLKPF